MKRLFTAAFILSISFGANAQKSVQVQESNESYSSGSHNSITVMVYSGNKGDVEKAWKRALKDMKGKVSAKKEIFADDCEMKDMGENSFDVYSKVVEVKGEGIKVMAAVDLGGAYMSSSQHSDQFKVMKNFLYGFGVDQNKAVIAVELKAAEKLLGDKEKELKDLEKDKDRLLSDIENFKKKIAEAEKSIEENGKSQEDKKVEIKEQEKAVKEVADRKKNVK